ALLPRPRPRPGGPGARAEGPLSAGTRRHLARLRGALAPSNAARVLKLLRAVRFFRGHRYVLPRAALACARALLRGRVLRAAGPPPGNAGQLRCAHCYATALTARAAPLELLARTVEELGRAGCLSVLLVGGEPTLSKDLERVVALVRQQRMLPFVFTNGQLL